MDTLLTAMAIMFFIPVFVVIGYALFGRGNNG
jgi:zinc transporter ZupT